MFREAADGGDANRAVARNAKKTLRIELLGDCIERSIEDVATILIGNQMGTLILGIDVGHMLDVDDR